VKAALRWCLYSLFAQADEVEGVIQALKLKDFVLVGHSMGGKIARIFAGRRPDGLRAVVLAAPAPPTPLYAPDAQKRSMLASYTTPEAIRDALKVINHRPLTIAQRLQVTEDSLGGAEAAKVAWVSQGMVLDISKQTDSITVPVCVIVRSADQVEKEAALREALLPLGPHAKFGTIEGVGHLSGARRGSRDDLQIPQGLSAGRGTPGLLHCLRRTGQPVAGAKQFDGNPDI
jgi:pimeloyl-ACP methyl ester carboxylesterase